MLKLPNIITGGRHQDQRGVLSFVNDFDISAVKRFYKIRHLDTKTIRGWRAHKIEQRWFHITAGTFLINVVAIDNWEIPKKDAHQLSFEISVSDDSVLHVPAGYATSLRALTENAEMVVFGDYAIEHASLDDHLFPSDYFINSKHSKDEN